MWEETLFTLFMYIVPQSTTCSLHWFRHVEVTVSNWGPDLTQLKQYIDYLFIKVKLTMETRTCFIRMTILIARMLFIKVCFSCHKCIIIQVLFPLSCSWDKQVISVREAKALPKSNSQEWRDKYICVEGSHYIENDMPHPPQILVYIDRNNRVTNGHRRHIWCVYSDWWWSLCFRAIWKKQRRQGSPREGEVWCH